jgi:integrase
MVKPWYRAGRGQWYATVNGQQVPLGVFGTGNEDAAIQALQTLLRKVQQGPVALAPDLRSWPERVELFIQSRTAKGIEARTVADYRRHLTFFLSHFGTKRPDEVFAPAESDPSRLVAPKVEDSAQKATWGENTRRNYLAAVETFFRWCGYRVSLEKPGRESAGAGAVIPEPVYQRAIAVAKGDLRGLLVFLWNTGCRPSEATRLTAADVNWESGTITLRQHKTRRRGKGRPRVVYLSPAAVEVLTAQREQYPVGLLFPNRRGGQWRDKALAQAVWRIAKKIGHRVTAYGCRHTYATRALEKGLPDTHVAALLGHGSTRMIHKHYAHLDQNARLLKEAAAKVG